MCLSFTKFLYSNIQQMKQSRNTGWEFYDKMLELNPDTQATGSRLYAPLTSHDVTETSNTSSTSPIDVDSYNPDDTTAISTNISPVASGKRKATDGGSDSAMGSSVMGPPLSSHRASSHRASSHHASSVTSQADSGKADSSKRKKTKTSKSAEVAASMRSSREQANTSSQNQEASTLAQIQQFISNTSDMTSMLRENFRAISQDPLGETYHQVAQTLASTLLGFSVQDRVDLMLAFLRDGGSMHMFIGSMMDPEMQRAFRLNLIALYREEREKARRSQ